MKYRNLSLNSVALAIATTVSLVKTTAAANYVIDGQFFSKAATDNIPFTAQFTGQTFNAKPLAQALNTTALYGVYLDAAGNFTFVQGLPVNSNDLAAGQASLMFPDNTGIGSAPGAGLPRGRAVVGYLRVAVGPTATGAFIPGTTALNATGITATFINAMAMPDEPLRS